MKPYDAEAELTMLKALRRDFHANPELGFEEERTSAIVREKLLEAGIEVVGGLGKTGLVGTLKVGDGNRAIALRADMDALAMPEIADRPYKSTVPGKMHACGHDGHTTMLLGAARRLAAERNFSGTVHFIFQPAEEGRGGALAMLRDGFFENSRSMPSTACIICRASTSTRWRWWPAPSLHRRIASR
jgi:hippurate hydrolase